MWAKFCDILSLALHNSGMSVVHHESSPHLKKWKLSSNGVWSDWTIGMALRGSISYMDCSRFFVTMKTHCCYRGSLRLDDFAFFVEPFRISSLWRLLTKRKEILPCAVQLCIFCARLNSFLFRVSLNLKHSSLRNATVRPFWKQTFRECRCRGYTLTVLVLHRYYHKLRGLRIKHGLYYPTSAIREKRRCRL